MPQIRQNVQYYQTGPNLVKDHVKKLAANDLIVLITPSLPEDFELTVKLCLNTKQPMLVINPSHQKSPAVKEQFEQIIDRYFPISLFQPHDRMVFYLHINSKNSRMGEDARISVLDEDLASILEQVIAVMSNMGRNSMLSTFYPIKSGRHLN